MITATVMATGTIMVVAAVGTTMLSMVGAVKTAIRHLTAAAAAVAIAVVTVVTETEIEIETETETETEAGVGLC
eukprot:COSAG05_NODE_1383_length_5019_cov_21.638618_2_plen_74_part_00